MLVRRRGPAQGGHDVRSRSHPRLRILRPNPRDPVTNFMNRTVESKSRVLADTAAGGRSADNKCRDHRDRG